MRRFLIILTIIAILLNIVTLSIAKEIPFTQEDRDRLIRLETKLDEGQKSLQKQIDDLKTFMLWGFGILFGGMGILIGFFIWVRRTALAPAISRNRDLEEREERIGEGIKGACKG